MPRSRHLPVLAGLVAIMGLAAPGAPAAAAADAGMVRLVRPAEADFDRYTLAPSAAERAFMARRFWRMRTYSPYFDQRLSWFPNAWTYRDLYAIYRDSDLAREHPEWILRDASGTKLYIPYDCGGGSCTQFAGDIGNAAFRAHWIAEAARQAARYRGLFIDDVNLEPRVSDGSGEPVVPIDARTGAPMTGAAWRRYTAEFAEQVRSALPGKEIVHNVLWTAGTEDPFARRQLDAATHVELERGATDPGITGGGGQFGYETFLAYIDRVHARGKGVVLDSYADTRAEVEYELATLFLVSSGGDALGSTWHTAPGDWWSGYEVNLGAPSGGRYAWRGLLRRNFERGYVLVNQPDRAPVSLTLEANALDPTGAPRPQLSLGAAEGAVVTTAPPPPAPVSGPVPTRTIVRSVPVGRRGAVLVRGRVKGAGRGGRVRVRVTRRAGRRWKNVRRCTAKARRHGRFRCHFVGLVRGRYRVRARFLGTPHALPSAARRDFAMRRAKAL